MMCMIMVLFAPPSLSTCFNLHLHHYQYILPSLTTTKTRGDPGRALEYFEMSLDLRQKAHGTEDHPDVGISYYSMATGYEYSSDFENSIECYKKCLEIWKKTLGEEHELTIKAEKSLDQVLTDKEQCLIC
mmetsp:Transcript_18782/g.30341  ORF Transcript_18782/g.30341 Transcript_18782/m.30341 type:complete len:130 (+) Transcript_18782:151-540(+)